MFILPELSLLIAIILTKKNTYLKNISFISLLFLFYSLTRIYYENFAFSVILNGICIAIDIVILIIFFQKTKNTALGNERNLNTWFIKLTIQLISLFVLGYYGFVVMKEFKSLSLIFLYWLFYIIINLITAGWRMMDNDYDAERDVKNAFKIVKKCPHCMKSLPSYFTSKCPHCTQDL